MVTGRGATPGAILRATPGATPRQRPGNGGATHTPNTPSVAPALGGSVHATAALPFSAIPTPAEGGGGRMFSTTRGPDPPPPHSETFFPAHELPAYENDVRAY